MAGGNGVGGIDGEVQKNLPQPVGSLSLSQDMKLFAEGDAITLTNALWWPLLVGLLLALISLFLYFIPRKMLKGFMGVNMKSRAFFWALVLDYAFRLSPFNFIHT